jgi:hypothetical protein
MARTRRKHSYRKSKRWNPGRSHRTGSKRAKRSQNRRGIRASSKGFRKAKRRGRTSVTTRKFMKLRRHAKNPGGVFHRTLRDGSKITVTEHGSVTVHDEGGREYDSYHIKPYEVNRFLKDLGHGRHANKGHYRYDDMAGEYQTLSRNPKRGRGRSRRNPAQFPMPFVSAMNPRRRGRKTRRNCGGGMRTRRNHPISRRDARSMKRVLRQHKYKCR